MVEEMVSLNKFLEEMTTILNERMERLERNIFTLQKRMDVLEKTLRETSGGRVSRNVLDQLKKA